ncbi:MAG: acyl-CoA synthetase FdrA [Candidatus Eisenbacteria bacterium]|nr:acyl-CoA synthetase FdrA [Candidatus Eisenbacteria bacterium]
MIVTGRVRKGAYHDSVALMTVGKAVAAREGVTDAALVMGTEENKTILRASGLWIEAFESAAATDLLIGVGAEDGERAEAALDAAEEALRGAGARSGREDEEVRPSSLEGALRVLPGADLALVSVAGRWAGAEARKALEAGLHVMLFSDNVPLETEVELKRFARERGLLVMGPDCGTAIWNGVPLAFANVVRRGSVGIVAASGTGLQEVSCLLDAEGAGVSQAIGTGGRDVSREVGGITFLQGIEALAADEATRVILLIAKPPHPEVLARIRDAARAAGKPVVEFFLGSAVEGGPSSLEEAALLAALLARGGDTAEVKRRIAARGEEIARIAADEAALRKPPRRWLRGLFSGGTFCSEAQILLAPILAPIRSNHPVGGAEKLADSLKSEGHTLVDLGEDEFTRGRPHPMIDYTLRNERIEAEAADPETAVILLDVVLGYGAHPDPVAAWDGAIDAAASRVSVVASVTGTEGDPQGKGRVIEALTAAGARVMPSNAAAALLAGRIAAAAEREAER